MANLQTIFVCSNCGEEYLKWQGKCDNCGLWNTLKEFKSQSARGRTKSKNYNTEHAEVVSLSDVKITNFSRISTKIAEFDRVLGGYSQKENGGLVPGSVILLGGDPGIGKSTLLLQAAANLPNVLYISGEESREQIKIRFDRLGLKTKSLKFLAETDLDIICQTIDNLKPTVAIIDSIQTVYSADFPSTPGSVVQVRECALRLQQLAKTSGIAVVLIGHVTKEGTVAGPRTLEHLVDVVLYLEGERFHQNRILRSAKNRFGATDEIGIFEMAEGGLAEVKNPSKLLLEERMNAAGSVVTATVEGSRALLVEVQALAAPTVFGYPQRRSAGFDLNRLQLLIAVLQKRANLNLANQDIFVNIVGGIVAKEPAVDLAVALAIASAVKNEKLSSRLCAFGEIGLSGEIRQVTFRQKREKEARRLGFTKFIASKNLNATIGEIKKYV